MIAMNTTSELAVRAVLPLVLDGEAKLADVGGGFRPSPLVDQGADVAFVVETRHRVVRLRLEPRAADAAACERLEDRKTAAAQQSMHQRGNEDRLAGARQAGDAEPYGRIE